ncbi:MAG: 4Fe-4S binding protein, partial [Thermoplasmata archaeon]
PDACIERDGDKIEINLKYCKGCGICAEECPVKAIIMVREESA